MNELDRLLKAWRNKVGVKRSTPDPMRMKRTRSSWLAKGGVIVSTSSMSTVGSTTCERTSTLSRRCIILQSESPPNAMSSWLSSKRYCGARSRLRPQTRRARHRRALVFTTFADTARYLYDHLVDWVRDELGVHIALVTGGDGNRSTSGVSSFVGILEQFAPTAQQRKGMGEEIDILIATDCLSEGQNLQDCDLVVNYDIHWNPVRLMQRFGRIDRLGSRNRQVTMINFWPTKDLDRYLDLKNRVEARMALANVAATGLDDPLDRGTEDVKGNAEVVQGSWRSAMNS